MATEAEIAWAAGLFEGEGTLYVACLNKTPRRPEGRLYPRARLCMTDEDAVQRFAVVVQVGNVTGPIAPPPKYPHWQPQWQWAVSSFEGFATFAALVRPWLCARRLAKLEEILEQVPKQPTDERVGKKLSDDDIVAIRASTETGLQVARRFGISRQYALAIKRGEQPQAWLKGKRENGAE